MIAIRVKTLLYGHLPRVIDPETNPKIPIRLDAVPQDVTQGHRGTCRGVGRSEPITQRPAGRPGAKQKGGTDGVLVKFTGPRVGSQVRR